MSIELSYGGAETKFFSWSCVQFFLYSTYGVVADVVKISVFRQIEPYQLVCVLYVALLPGGVRVCEEHRHFELSAQEFMCGGRSPSATEHPACGTPIHS